MTEQRIKYLLYHMVDSFLNFVLCNRDSFSELTTIVLEAYSEDCLPDTDTIKIDMMDFKAEDGKRMLMKMCSEMTFELEWFGLSIRNESDGSYVGLYFDTKERCLLLIPSYKIKLKMENVARQEWCDTLESLTGYKLKVLKAS